jgi:hypothetical protein
MTHSFRVRMNKLISDYDIIYGTTGLTPEFRKQQPEHSLGIIAGLLGLFDKTGGKATNISVGVVVFP